MQCADAAGERTSDKTDERTGERTGERADERSSEQTDERMAKGGERTGERTGERADERNGERTGERTGVGWWRADWRADWGGGSRAWWTPREATPAARLSGGKARSACKRGVGMQGRPANGGRECKVGLQRGAGMRAGPAVARDCAGSGGGARSGARGAMDTPAKLKSQSSSNEILIQWDLSSNGAPRTGGWGGLRSDHVSEWLPLKR